MKKESLYLDTSVPSAYYDDRTTERQKETVKFWSYIIPNYSVYISDITVRELSDTKDNKLKSNLMKLVSRFKVYKTNRATEDLAEAYIENEVVPGKYFIDALHIAIASYHNVDFLVSWNFEHLIKVKTRRLVKSINVLKGYGELEIVAPIEL